MVANYFGCGGILTFLSVLWGMCRKQWISPRTCLLFTGFALFTGVDLMILLFNLAEHIISKIFPFRKQSEEDEGVFGCQWNVRFSRKCECEDLHENEKLWTWFTSKKCKCEDPPNENLWNLFILPHIKEIQREWKFNEIEFHNI